MDYGAVDFRIDGSKVGATSNSGAAFGELALMYNDRRKASVIATNPTMCA